MYKIVCISRPPSYTMSSPSRKHTPKYIHTCSASGSRSINPCGGRKFWMLRSPSTPPPPNGPERAPSSPGTKRRLRLSVSGSYDSRPGRMRPPPPPPRPNGGPCLPRSSPGNPPERYPPYDACVVVEERGGGRATVGLRRRSGEGMGRR